MINGEGYYRSFHIQQKKPEESGKISSNNQDSFDVTNVNSNLTEFLDFLEYDISSNVQRCISNEKIKYIVRNKVTSAACTLQECKLENNLLSRCLKICTKKRLNEAKSLYSRKKNEISRKLKLIEHNLMRHILDYYCILLDELNETRYKLANENTENLLLRARYKFLRDLKYFSYHLNLETKGKVTLTILEHDSAQAKRCRKAIKENVNFARIIGPNIYDNIKVIQVFKLDHTLLSSALQSKATTAESGNIKGLFCLVPKSSLYTFCCYGLHSQKYSYSDFSNLETNFPGLFNCPWFLNSCENSFQNYNTCGVARQLSLSNLGFSNIKFSRFSTPLCNTTADSLQNKNSDNPLVSENDLEEGLIIALCRVLVCQLRTISSDITDLEIQQAINNKNDSIYSTKTEEYVLLNPQCVLPEFLMHVSYEINLFDKSNKIKTGTKSESSIETISSIVSWIPPQLVSNGINSSSSSDVGNLFTLNKFNSALKCKKQNQIDYVSLSQKNNDYASKENIVSDIEKTIQNFNKSVK